MTHFFEKLPATSQTLEKLRQMRELQIKKQKHEERLAYATLEPAELIFVDPLPRGEVYVSPR